MALDPITAGIDLAKTFIGKFVKDKDLAAKLLADAESEEFQGSISLMMGQIAINKIEAASKSLFVAGWRPAVGWTCALGLFVKFIILPIGSWVATVCFDVAVTDIPEFSVVELMTLLGGMLGLGTLRTVEKTKGVASS